MNVSQDAGRGGSMIKDRGHDVKGKPSRREDAGVSAEAISPP